MNVSSFDARLIGRWPSRRADMPMTCLCQETVVASQLIALYIFKKSALSDTAWLWDEQPNPSVTGHHDFWLEDTHLAQRNAQ
jgi:hypothetical protein